MRKMLEHFQQASAKMNKHFILIETYYGCNGPSIDPDAPKHFFSPDIEDDEVLGQATLMALKFSRKVAVDEIPILFDRDKIKEIYDDHISQTMKRFGCKTKSALLKRTKSVFIRKFGESISFSPSRQEKIDAWGSDINDKFEKVVIPFSSTPIEVGVALRLAFDRCIA